MPVTRWTRAAAAASSLLLALSCTETTAPGTPQPPPSLYAISPSSVPAGSGPFTLTVSGADFTAQSRVRWNDADRPTTFVSDSVLTARIGGADVTFADSASVTVYTGAPGGGTSGRLAFKVASPQTLTWTLTNVPLSAGSWDVAVSPNGLAYVTQLGGDSIDRIDVPTNTVAGSIAVGNWPYEVSFNGTGSVAYESNAVDHSIGVINTATDSQTASFGLATQPIRLRIGPGGSKLYVTTTTGAVLVLDPSNGTTVHSPISVTGVLNGVALTPDGSRLWVSNTTGTLTEINTATDSVHRAIAMGGRPQDLAISPDGALLYVANESGWLGIYDLATLERVDSVTVPGAFGLALNPSGSQLWIAQSAQGTITVFGTAYRGVAGTINTGGIPRHIAFTAGGAALIANEGGVVQIARQNP